MVRPLKKSVSKAEVREKLEEETERFLRKGGEVKEIPVGESGKNPDDPPLYLNRRLFVEPRESRTLVPEVVAAIEARRLEKRSRKSQRAARRTPQRRRKMIYDDFGEPLRQVWIDD